MKQHHKPEKALDRLSFGARFKVFPEFNEGGSAVEVEVAPDNGAVVVGVDAEKKTPP